MNTIYLVCKRIVICVGKLCILLSIALYNAIVERMVGID
jgi:hypothetical protein